MRVPGTVANVSTSSALSVFDIFRVGIGPSSSHTVGPMRAARQCAIDLADSGNLEAAARVDVELLGSLGATGRGHSTNTAVVLGLSGLAPDTVTTADIDECLSGATGGHLVLASSHGITFDLDKDITFRPDIVPARHPNGLRIRVLDAMGNDLMDRIYYSIGGGFIVEDDHNAETDQQYGCAPNRPSTTQQPGGEDNTEEGESVPYPFATSVELLGHCDLMGMSIAEVMMANEEAIDPHRDVVSELNSIWTVMDSCIDAGIHAEGTLPGPLHVRRRAASFHDDLVSRPDQADPLRGMDWVNLWALAVTEENASGHRIVTAPTNGAAGIVPAVLKYYMEFESTGTTVLCDQTIDPEQAPAVFLLTAGAVGLLIKRNASIAGAEVGCQGEVGSACSMAAAGLTQVLGGTPAQVENAAEIAMEHSLGLTCDPIGGLVQIPCIERNAISAVKAIDAARMALRGDGLHAVSLDAVIETMRQTGLDMNRKYKETAQGGLAVNIVEC